MSPKTQYPQSFGTLSNLIASINKAMLISLGDRNWKLLISAANCSTVPETVDLTFDPSKTTTGEFAQAVFGNIFKSPAEATYAWAYAMAIAAFKTWKSSYISYARGVQIAERTTPIYDSGLETLIESAEVSFEEARNRVLVAWGYVIYLENKALLPIFLSKEEAQCYEVRKQQGLEPTYQDLLNIRAQVENHYARQ